MIDTLIKSILTTDNIAIIILCAILGVTLWLHVVWRREEREDRKGLYDLIDRNTAALHAVEKALAALSERLR